MPFNIEYDADEEIVVSTFIGEITMTVIKEYIAALLPVLEETRCRKLLSDSRNGALKVSSIDILKFPKMAEASPLTSRLKRALLTRPGTSGYEMYATMCNAHGQSVKLFNSRAEAIAWLHADN
ncbi:hypothetical protein [Pontiella agarivorans]|uniref:STAS/SEC14 domain-containing protein n=1 Tax=Pontiella agarivorans TaxID=3038953 RepID=A0ABU5MX46_9BACT|nr:hypothetical protein [Pontiella agarivorans]MDZ8118747.1 hypothetical protein [Pontiella agarivorans]